MTTEPPKVQTAKESYHGCERNTFPLMQYDINHLYKMRAQPWSPWLSTNMMLKEDPRVVLQGDNLNSSPRERKKNKRTTLIPFENLLLLLSRFFSLYSLSRQLKQKNPPASSLASLSRPSVLSSSHFSHQKTN